MIIVFGIVALLAFAFVLYAMFYVGAGRKRPTSPAFDRYHELSRYLRTLEATTNADSEEIQLARREMDVLARKLTDQEREHEGILPGWAA
jgi:hypothetical protein